MSLTSEFLSDTPTFLKTYAVLVPESLDTQLTRPGVHKFKLEAAEKNAVRLAIGADGEESFPAYYLPWKRDVAVSTDLGTDAAYFFTSQLTNCRFSVLNADNVQTPKVAHVAGNSGNSAARDRMETSAGFVDDSSTGRARRFSISGSIEKRGRKPVGGGPTPVVPKLHDYAGTSVKEAIRSSAFVYGIRDDTKGWSFFAQIVKGDMSATVVADVAILSHAHHI